MMICSTDTRHLSRLMDGDLSPEAASQLRRHVATCPRCAHTVGGFRDIEAVYASASPMVEVPRDFRARTMERVNAARPRDYGGPRGRLLRAAIAIAGAAAAVFLLVVYLGAAKVPLEGTALRLDEGGIWRPVLANATISAGETIAVPNLTGARCELRLGTSRVSLGQGSLARAVDPSAGRIELYGGVVDVRAGDERVVIQTRTGDVVIDPGSSARIELPHPVVSMGIGAHTTASVLGLLSSAPALVVDRDGEKSMVRVASRTGGARLTPNRGDPIAVEADRVVVYAPSVGETWSAPFDDREGKLSVGENAEAAARFDAIFGAARDGAVAACGNALSDPALHDEALRILVGLARSLGATDVSRIESWLDDANARRRHAAIWMLADRGELGGGADRIRSLAHGASDNEARVASVIALVNAGGVEGRATAIESATLRGVPLSTRILAARSLVEIGEIERAGHAVFALLTSEDPAERSAGEHLVRGGVLPTQERDLIAVLEDGRTSPAIAMRIAASWAELGREDAIIARLDAGGLPAAARDALVRACIRRATNRAQRDALAALPGLDLPLRLFVARSFVRSGDGTDWVLAQIEELAATDGERAAELLVSFAEIHDGYPPILDEWRAQGPSSPRGRAVLIAEAKASREGYDRALDAVVGMSRETPDERAQIARALLRLEIAAPLPDRGADLLEVLVGDLPADERVDGWAALARCGRASAARPLRAHVTDARAHPYGQVRPLYELVALGDPADRELAREIARDGSRTSALRRQAAAILAQHGIDPGPSDDRPVEPDAVLRFWLALARDRLDAAGFRRAAEAWSEVSAGDRRALLGPLAGVDDARLHGWLVATLCDDSDRLTRIAAAGIAGSLGEPAASELIAALRRDSDWTVRLAAATRPGARPSELLDCLRTRPADLSPTDAESLASVLGVERVDDAGGALEPSARLAVWVFARRATSPQGRARGTDRVRVGAWRATRHALAFEAPDDTNQFGERVTFAIDALFEATGRSH